MVSPEMLKPIGQWTIDDIATLPTAELDWFEVKSSEWILKPDIISEFSRYVSAYANYDGGYMLLGVTNPTPGNALILDQGVSFTYKNGTVEWLENMLPASVDPHILKIQVQAISLTPGAKRGPIIIYIPASNKPHQAKDGKFYTRTGSQCRSLGTPAILDIIHRQRHPVVKPHILINVWQYDTEKRSGLRWDVTNESEVLCSQFGMRIRVPLHDRGEPIIFEKPAYLETENNLRFWTLNINNTINQPLFPKATLGQIIPVKFGGVFKDELNKEIKIETLDSVHVRMFADAAPYSDFIFPLNDILTRH